MVKVYCDNGANLKILKRLESSGFLELYEYPYERSKLKTNNIAPPTSPTWNQMNVSWDNLNFTWDEMGFTDKYKLLLKNGFPETDAKHLDSAFRAKCKFFVTADKGDIYNKKKFIKEELGIEVLHNNDLSILENT